PLASQRDDAEQAIRVLMPVDDLRERSDVDRPCGPGLRAFHDEQHTELLGLLHAAPDHIDVARLEDPQRQHAAREQHGLQGEQRRRFFPHRQSSTAARSTARLTHLAAAERLLKHARQTLEAAVRQDRKSTRLNSSHVKISYAVFCLKKKIYRDA